MLSVIAATHYFLNTVPFKGAPRHRITTCVLTGEKFQIIIMFPANFNHPIFAQGDIFETEDEIFS